MMLSKEKLRQKLRMVNNYKSFKKFEKELKENDMKLMTKRTHRYAFDFSEDYNPSKANYLIDDGISVGRCRWENLHAYLEITEG